MLGNSVAEYVQGCQVYETAVFPSIEIAFRGDHFNPQTSKSTRGNCVKLAQFIRKTADLATQVM